MDLAQNAENKSHNFNCQKCHYITTFKKDFNKHVLTAKHIKNSQDEDNCAIADAKFSCSLCRYDTSRKFDFDRHNNSSKHIAKLKSIQSRFTCNLCKRVYTTKTNLNRHSKTCIPSSNDTSFQPHPVFQTHTIMNFISQSKLQDSIVQHY